ncbi:hypothetical protein CCP3SC15_400003 [Gammaproteobacteria bacterium]
MEIRFRYDPERMTLGDHITLEMVQDEPQAIKSSQLRDLLAHHMTNDAGEWIEKKAAYKILNDLTDPQIESAITKLNMAITGARAALIPPDNSGA